MNRDLLTQPAMKKLFAEYNSREWVRLFKVACWVCAIAMPSAVFLDMIDYPNYVAYFLELRLVCVALAMVLLGVVYTPWGPRHQYILTLFLAIIPQGFVCWMIYITDGAVSPYYQILNLPLLIYCLLFPWTYLATFSLSIITMVFYLTACFAHGGASGSGLFLSNIIFLLYTVSFAVIGSYFTNGLRAREFISQFELDQSRKQLEESNQKLVEMDLAKNRFFANISHELRTPLTLLLSPLESIQKMKSHLLDEETKGVLSLMHNNAMRLLKLINDLLDLVKLESGRTEVSKGPLKVEEFIKGLALSVQPAAKEKRIALSTTVGVALGTILADQDKLEKITLNLLFNSLKFTQAGGLIELSANAEGPFLVLKVKDTGMGISELDLPRIFDRFWQADTSSQRKYQGTGIGLALVKELAEAMGGSISAESQMHKGTAISVKIPLERPKEEAASLPDVSSGAAPAGEKAESPEWLSSLYRRAELFPAITPVSETIRRDDFSSGKPKVLVADDEPDMLRYLRSQLEGNFTVLEAVDGNQAVEKTRQFLPDLVLLDMMMPEKDGVQACREIKSSVSTQSIPVILLTARADEETRIASLNVGANDFLTKPFSATELHIRVRNLVQSHGYQKDLALEKSALETTLEQLKETEGQLVQNEKMASLGRLSAGIIHEINNPLNYSVAALRLLRPREAQLPEEERAKFKETLADIEEGLGRVAGIVSDLRAFSHPKSGGMDLIDLEDVVSFSLRFLNHELADKVRVEVEVPGDQKVLADKNKLTQVLINLIQNSLDAFKRKDFQGEKPVISVKSRQVDGKVLVEFRDNGSGIGEKDLDKIFDPFYTTKDVGEGMGLGLSICYKAMMDQGGKISAASERGKFTLFTLELPSGT